MKKRILFLLLFSATLFASWGQKEFNQKILSHFAQTWYRVPQEKVYLQTDKPYYSAGEDIWFKPYLVNAATHRSNSKTNFVYVELLSERDSLIKRVKIRKDSMGFHGHIYLDPHINAGNYYLRAYTNWMKNTDKDFFFHKNFYIGNTLYEQKTKVPLQRGTNYSVQFFPESGNFLNDRLQTIGFKAIGEDGLSIAVEGKLYNNLGEELVEFNTMHRGMGKIFLNTHPGESYYAVTKSLDGVEKRVDLPKTDSAGISIRTFYSRGNIQYEVLNQSGLPLDSLKLLIHSRGFVKYVLPLHNETGIINEQLLPEGINSFSVIDKQWNLYCERLYFSRNFQQDLIRISTDKDSYGPREKIQLELFMLSPDGSPAKGEYSVSVTDKEQVLLDSLQDNILSYLTLSSDIKGYIEAPNEYFADNSMLTREKTDILLITQGWKRFSTADILKGKFAPQRHFLEAGQTLSGRVLNLFNKPVANSEIIMFSNYKHQIATTKTDSTGTYLLDGISFPDSTSMALKAKSKSRIIDVGIEPFADAFPSVNKYFPDLSQIKQHHPEEYFYQQKSKYIADGGLLMVDLGEISVTAEKKKQGTTYYYSGMADNTFNSQKLEDFLGLGVLDIISMFPGVEVNGENISVRGASGNPLFVVNGIETDRLEDIMYLNQQDIEEISLYKGVNTAIFGSRGGNGVITVNLKEGVDLEREAPPSLAVVKPLGYQKPAEFYVPAYDVDSVYRQRKPDYRTTIYWNPHLVPDETGKVNLDFYSADKNDEYQVELEGISEKGNVSHFVRTIKRNRLQSTLR